MKTKSRVASILKANSLDPSVTGFPSFYLSELNVVPNLEIQLPSNLRLGHLAERVVSEFIRTSSIFDLLYENVQIIEDKRTIGEIDFIIENINTKQVIHMELAYKFYLYDPSISTNPLNNWIGPNRNDSLKEKLEKLKKKQFPLLYHSCAKSQFDNIEIDKVSQALCLLVSLFIPYEYKANFGSDYKKAVQGYYIKLDTFIDLDDSSKTYYMPSKKEWGMRPSENESWAGMSGVEKHIRLSLEQRQAPLCWQKHNDTYGSFFIVWW